MFNPIHLQTSTNTAYGFTVARFSSWKAWLLDDSFVDSAINLWNAWLFGGSVASSGFVDSAIKAGKIKPLGALIDCRSVDHLTKLRDKYHDNAPRLEVQKETASSELRIKKILVSEIKHDNFVSEKKARQKVEDQRILANIIGLAVVISVYYSKGHYPRCTNSSISVSDFSQYVSRPLIFI